MEIKKLELNVLEQAASMLKAIAHPQRIEILNLMQQKERMTVTEIQQCLGLPQSVTSHHLGILKDKGVLTCKREGKNIYYELKHQVLSQIIQCILTCNKQ
ncbi:MAG TPA: metalloregulator ArsR/SmtB family transcription factor [Salinivirgaceae bacterium]|nr:metalloregulator ArsR/SmtB family transcription factor [Salinivirgaceae bacterium]